METIKINGKTASKGYAKGEALVSKDMFAFGGTPELETGIVKEKNHDIFGQNVAGKVLVYPTGKGSTGDPYSCYFLMKHGNAPKAIINRTANPTTVVSAILANIPMMYSLEKDPLDVIKTGDIVEVNANEGFILINKI
jgi:predicted aconitase with swiveling domain